MVYLFARTWLRKSSHTPDESWRDLRVRVVCGRTHHVDSSCVHCGIMEKTNDGFLISEKDLEIRGQGDILGTRQSGIQTFKIGNIVRDLEILEEARKEAELYLTQKRLNIIKHNIT